MGFEFCGHHHMQIICAVNAPGNLWVTDIHYHTQMTTKENQNICKSGRIFLFGLAYAKIYTTLLKD